MEALGQSIVTDMIRKALHALLPEPLADVHVREDRERKRLAKHLAGFNRPRS